jgi:hypothetical protein
MDEVSLLGPTIVSLSLSRSSQPREREIQPRNRLYFFLILSLSVSIFVRHLGFSPVFVLASPPLFRYLSSPLLFSLVFSSVRFRGFREDVEEGEKGKRGDVFFLHDC